MAMHSHSLSIQGLNNIPVAEVESLVISLILDQVIDAKVDQVTQLVIVRQATYVIRCSSRLLFAMASC
jgi:hypothetical protein